MRRVVERCIEIDAARLPIVQRCLQEMHLQAANINPTADSYTVVHKFRTGYLPPTDIPFEDFGQSYCFFLCFGD